MNKKILFIYLYSCCGLGVGMAQNLSNGDFEDWGDQSVDIYRRAMFGFDGCANVQSSYSLFQTFEAKDRPLGFTIVDDLFKTNPSTYTTRTTDPSEVYQGSSAVRMRADNFIVGLTGLFVPEELVQEAIPVPYPFSEVPASIDGFYKHTSGPPRAFPAGTCTVLGGGVEEDGQTIFYGGFAVYAVFTKWNVEEAKRDTVASTYEVYDDTDQYTAFSAPIELLQESAVPDSIIFVLSSCPDFLSPAPVAIDGSVTFVDNVDFTFCDPIDKTTNLNARTLTSNEENADSYQWIDCANENAPIDGATDRTFTAEANGDYAVIITKNQCSVTSVCTFVDITSCNSASTENIEACFEYTWLGDTYFETGTYTATLPNSVGCDSLLTLNLTIDTVNTIINEVEGTLSSLQPNATYQWLDCNNDNETIPGATSQIFSPENSGRYAVEITTQEGCFAVSECEQLDIILGIDGSWVRDVKLYPNPVQDQFSILLDRTYAKVTLRVRDSRGVLLEERSFSNSAILEYELKAQPGIYYVQLNAGDKTANLTLKKN